MSKSEPTKPGKSECKTNQIMPKMPGETEPKGLMLTPEEIPYGTNVHLDANVYDGLKRKAFIEGAAAQLAHLSAMTEEVVDEVVSILKRDRSSGNLKKYVQQLEDDAQDIVSIFAARAELAYNRGKAMKPDPDGVYENGKIDGIAEEHTRAEKDKSELLTKIKELEGTCDGWEEQYKFLKSMHKRNYAMSLGQLLDVIEASKPFALGESK